MKTSSAKNKGRRLQKLVVDKIKEIFSLSDRDVWSTPMGCTGEDVGLSDNGFIKFPFSVEAKNTEKINIWKSLEQSEQTKREGTPLLVFKRNNSKVYCTLEFNYFMELIRRASEKGTDIKIN